MSLIKRDTLITLKFKSNYVSANQNMKSQVSIAE